MPGPLGYLGRRDAAVEPCGDAGLVALVVVVVGDEQTANDEIG